MLNIPDVLVTNIREGNAVLVLGAGASFDATLPNGASVPSSRDLAVLLSKQFLGGKFKNEALSVVSEYAVSESSLTKVQDYIRGIFAPLEPASFHHLIARFRWHGLATTNFDQVIEKAYGNERERLQQVQPIISNSDSIQNLMIAPDSIPLLKLHGCVSQASNTKCPLILTIDQYVTHLSGRSRLFTNLEEWAYEKPLVFVGNSIQDTDLRGLLLRLAKLGEARNRYYAIAPDADDIIVRFWETKRITAIKATFKNFLETLDTCIPSHIRPLARLAQLPSRLPISRHFARNDIVLTETCRRFLTESAEYVAGLTAFDRVEPRTFYRGEDCGWAALEQDLDVRRKILDTILGDVVLMDEGRRHPLEYILVKGHAGSGKSIIMRRMAWDASREFGALCLFLKSHRVLDITSIQELLDVVKDRIYLFVDDAAEHVRELVNLAKAITRSGQRLTVVLGERVNEWNIYGSALESLIAEQYLVEYLEPQEIKSLLNLLEKHKALGTLENESKAARVAAFSDRAGRQLLVALHEATLGKSFEEIIEDEFSHIVPVAARDLYLTICVLNRLNVPVRAGLISRVHGIPFNLFKKVFFAPLEHVVKTEEDPRIRDYVYAARHPYIADMVFKRVLVHAADRLDKYLLALGGLNLSYSTDTRAFRQMIRGKVVNDLFPERGMADQVFRVAQDRGGEEAFALQQRAIYEMCREDTDFTVASELLNKAAEVAPHDISIKHSLAELNLHLADEARTPLEREQRLRDAGKIARSLRTERTGTEGAHAYHTLIKIATKRLAFLLEEGQTGLTQPDVTGAIRHAEEAVEDGLQRFPNDSYLLTAESTLAQLLQDSERALLAMRSAFQANPRNSYIAARLSRSYELAGNTSDARQTLERALEANPADCRLHLWLAKLIMRHFSEDAQVIEYHLKRSFIPEDSNYEAQLLYGRQLYSNGKIDDATKVFTQLKSARVPYSVRKTPSNPLPDRSTGRVRRVEATYCRFERDGSGDWIFADRRHVDPDLRARLQVGVRVSFSISFNFMGPIATEVYVVK